MFTKCALRALYIALVALLFPPSDIHRVHIYGVGNSPEAICGPCGGTAGVQLMGQHAGDQQSRTNSRRSLLSLPWLMCCRTTLWP